MKIESLQGNKKYYKQLMKLPKEDILTVCNFHRLALNYLKMKALSIQIIKLNSLYPVLEDAERSVADLTHGEASNH